MPYKSIHNRHRYPLRANAFPLAIPTLFWKPTKLVLKIFKVFGCTGYLKVKSGSRELGIGQTQTLNSRKSHAVYRNFCLVYCTQNLNASAQHYAQ